MSFFLRALLCLSFFELGALAHRARRALRGQAARDASAVPAGELVHPTRPRSAAETAAARPAARRQRELHAVEAQLAAMGYAPPLAQRAIAATDGAGLADALTWLLQQRPGRGAARGALGSADELPPYAAVDASAPPADEQVRRSARDAGEAPDDETHYVAGAEKYQRRFAGSAASGPSAALVGDAAPDYDSEGNYAAANEERDAPPPREVVYDEVFYERRAAPAASAPAAAAASAKTAVAAAAAAVGDAAPSYESAKRAPLATTLAVPSGGAAGSAGGAADDSARLEYESGTPASVVHAQSQSDDESESDSDDEDDEDEDEDEDDDSSDSGENAIGSSGGFGDDLSRTTEFERLLRQQSQGTAMQVVDPSALPQSAALGAAQRPTPYWRWNFPDAAAAREAERSRGSIATAAAAAAAAAATASTTTTTTAAAAAATTTTTAAAAAGGGSGGAAASAAAPETSTQGTAPQAHQYMSSAAAAPTSSNGATRSSHADGYTRMPSQPFQLRAPQRGDSHETKAVFVSSTQREIYRYVAAAHERVYEQVERIVRYEMERMCAAIDQLQLLRRLSDLEAQTAQQLETIAVLQSEIAGGVERHHGELSKLADMAADEIVPLAQKYERAQRKTRKFKQELSCVLCRSKKRSMIALPCAHLATCRKCMVGLTTCPICSVDVERWQLILLE